MNLRTIVLLAFIVIGTCMTRTMAQSDTKGNITLKSGTLSFEEKSFEKYLSKPSQFKKSGFNGGYELAIQLNSGLSEDLLERFTKIGISFHGYLGRNTYSTRVPASFKPEKLRGFPIQNVSNITALLKLSPELQRFQASIENDDATGNESLTVAMSFNSAANMNFIETDLLNIGASNIDFSISKYGYIIFDMPAYTLTVTSELPYVTYLEAYSRETIPLNYNLGPSTRSSALSAQGFSSARNLTGQGIMVGIGDGGEVVTSGTDYHIDRNKKIFNETSGTAFGWGFHADHISGSIAGLGNLDPDYRGVAPDASIVTEKSAGILIQFDTLKTQHDIQVINGSFGPAGNNCENFGVYGAMSNLVDAQARQYSDLLHVFAAGNHGNQTCGSNPYGYHTVLRDYASSKNALVVGAVRNKRRILDNLSSRGPVADGRIKPEIVASGMNVGSTIPGNQYAAISGTSMSTAAVSGNIALIAESYAQLNGDQKPDGGLLKAVVCNSAKDLGNPGPDYCFGFGAMNSRKAVETIENSNFFTGSISTNQVINHTINVPTGTHEVKVLLYWVDHEAESGAAVALVNDLDLSVSMGSDIFEPWVLNSDPALVSQNAIRGQDHLNNIEQVTFNPTSGGTCQLNISGFNIPFGPQTYYLVYEFIQPSVVVTYPFGGETFNKDEKEEVRWDAYGPGAENVTIEYSIDGGYTWIEIPAFDIDSDAQEFATWYPPNVNTSTALLKVSIDGTNIYDVSDNYFTISGEAQNLLVTDNCQDQISLEWDPIEGISTYEVLMLDTVMKFHKRVHDTKAVITNLIAGQEYWFSVRPILENGSKGKRSIAINTVPSSSPCNALSDIGVDVVISPSGKGRKYTSSEFVANELITIQISNSGNTPVSNFPVSYQLNNEAVIQEMVNLTIQPGSSITYTFNTTANLDSDGEYIINSWTSLAGDINIQNDNAAEIHKVKHLPNEPVTFPLNTENFETLSDTVLVLNDMAIPGLDRCDFTTTGIAGRLRTNAGSGFTQENRAITLDNAYTTTRTVNEMILTYNLSQEVGTELFLNFQYMNHGQEADNANSVFARGSDLDNWIKIFDLDDNQAASGMYAAPSAPINLSAILAYENQSISSSFQIRFCQAGLDFANDQFGNDGYTFDNIELLTSSLPIELAIFEARKLNSSDVILVWETYTETGNMGFDIEVAEDEEAVLADNFKKIGYVEGAGTSQEIIKYTFVDRNAAQPGTRYYRLKQIDFDGKSTYSPVRSVTYTSVATSIEVFPNPATSFVNVNIESDAASELQMRIFDSNGRLVAEKRDVLEANQQAREVMQLDDQLLPGMYFLQIFINNQWTVRKFMKANP